MSAPVILVVNPGSTSTKIAVYDGRTQRWQQNIEHDAKTVASFPTIFAQLSWRADTVREALSAHDTALSSLAAIMARGGLLPPLDGGAYRVNDAMLDVLEHRPMNHHASNLGAAIADMLGREAGVPAYIYDPVTVDEMIDLVRITGLKEIRRHGQGHNLNMRAAARRYCQERGRAYEDMTLIVAHLGGGVTLSLHQNGRIIDMVSDDEGAFAPERAGLIPAFKLAKLAYLDGMDYKTLMKKLQRQGGLVSHLGVTDARQVEAMIEAGDQSARLVYEAMALSVARSIASLSVVVSGQVDAIILTGGIAYSETFTGMVAGRVGRIAPVAVLPGENEMQALADGCCRVLAGEEQASVYAERPEARPF